MRRSEQLKLDEEIARAVEAEVYFQFWLIEEMTRTAVNIILGSSIAYAFLAPVAYATGFNVYPFSEFRTAAVIMAGVLTSLPFILAHVVAAIYRTLHMPRDFLP